MNSLCEVPCTIALQYGDGGQRQRVEAWQTCVCFSFLLYFFFSIFKAFPLSSNLDTK